MVTTTQVKNGLVKYIDSDLLTHLSGWKKVALGSYVALAAQNAEAVVDRYRTHPAVSILNVIDENGNIDIEKLYAAVSANFADGQKVSFDIPIIGVYTISKADVERMYQFIISA